MFDNVYSLINTENESMSAMCFIDIHEYQIIDNVNQLFGVFTDA